MEIVTRADGCRRAARTRGPEPLIGCRLCTSTSIDVESLVGLNHRPNDGCMRSHQLIPDSSCDCSTEVPLLLLAEGREW